MPLYATSDQDVHGLGINLSNLGLTNRVDQNKKEEEAVPPIYMSNDRLEPFNYHNIAFKRCTDVVSLGRLDRL